MLVLDIWCYRSDTDAHCPNEHKRIEILPALAYIRTADNLCLVLLGIHLTEQQTGNMLALLTDLYDCYLLHFNIVIG